MGPLGKIEQQLDESGASFIDGDAPSSSDHTAFSEVIQKNLEPDPKQTPSVYAWYLLVGQFDPAIRSQWPAGKKAAPKDAGTKAQDGGNKKDKKDKKEKKGGEGGGGANARAEAKQARLLARQQKGEGKNKKD